MSKEDHRLWSYIDCFQYKVFATLVEHHRSNHLVYHAKAVLISISALWNEKYFGSSRGKLRVKHLRGAMWLSSNIVVSSVYT